MEQSLGAYFVESSKDNADILQALAPSFLLEILVATG